MTALEEKIAQTLDSARSSHKLHVSQLYMRASKKERGSLPEELRDKVDRWVLEALDELRERYREDWKELAEL